MEDNRCVACGSIIPEGRQVCPNCESKVMKDKEKQIEEMANEALEHCNECKNGCEKCEQDREERPFCNYKCNAKHLVEKGWIKLPEDSVVLSKEDLQNLAKLEIGDWASTASIRKIADAVEKQARKETAEKILKLVFKHITTLEVWKELQHNTWLSSGGNFTANKHIWDLLLEPIAQQVGVEIKEN